VKSALGKKLKKGEKDEKNEHLGNSGGKGARHLQIVQRGSHEKDHGGEIQLSVGKKKKNQTVKRIVKSINYRGGGEGKCQRGWSAAREKDKERSFEDASKTEWSPKKKFTALPWMPEKKKQERGTNRRENTGKWEGESYQKIKSPPKKRGPRRSGRAFQ